MAMSAVYTNFGGRIVHEKRGADGYRHCSDPLGSSVAVIDSSDGSTVYEAEYWPYGEVQTETGTNPSSLGFIGLLGYFRDISSLLYVRARHYLTQKARWLTVDPLWPSELPYNYVFGAPIAISDASGLQALPKPILDPGPPLKLIPGGAGQILKLPCLGPIAAAAAAADIIAYGVNLWIDSQPEEELPDCSVLADRGFGEAGGLTDYWDKSFPDSGKPIGPIRQGGSKKCTGGFHWEQFYNLGKFKGIMTMLCCPCTDRYGFHLYCQAWLKKRT